MQTVQATTYEQLIKEDGEKGEFLVKRSAFLDPKILEIERKKIFSKCWLYLGHESEVENPGEFKTRRVGGRSLIFVKDSDGKIKALYNTCPHRGALVCREKEGKTKVFQCFYHAWTFNNKGELVGQPGASDGSYPADYNCDGSKNLREIARLDSYRGFIFVNFDPNAMSLKEYLADATEYLDLIADQSEQGMQVIGSAQQYSVKANYKLLAENSYDGYHAIPVHKTYFEYISKRTGGERNYDSKRFSQDLGNGHAVVASYGLNPWGRPVAKTRSDWSAEENKEVEEKYRKLVAKYGEEYAERVAKSDRNMVIFPNLVINDIMAITIRTFDPITPDYMEVNAWALGTKEESDTLRERRLNNFLEFFGPAGFSSPDDVEALELVQEGISTNRELEWNDISKGMKREGNQRPDDEQQMRVYWKQWDQMMKAEDK